jgi:hypothetical protein
VHGYIFIAVDRGIFLEIAMAIENNVVSENRTVVGLLSRDNIVFQR